MSCEVSVVVPALNMADWLPATLQSIQHQTYPHDHLEVIVVDDGSVDGTADIAARILSSGDITHAVIEMPVSGGPSAARNAGWQRARGAWIQFLDADDLIDSRKIALQAEALASCSAEVAAVFSRWGRLRLRDGRWREEAHGELQEMGADPIVTVLDDRAFIHAGSQLFNRRWLERIAGWDERLNMIEDVDLQLRLLMAGGTFRRVPAASPVFWYRQRRHSLSQMNSRAFIDGIVRNTRLVEEFWRSRNMLTPARAAILAGHYFAAARQLAAFDREGFDDLVGRVFALCPAFEPPQRSLRFLTRILGYPRAERLAVTYRRLKGRLHLAPRTPQATSLPTP